ncbi:integrating conjugative element protein [Allopusillimonas ginsengisoli]|uniref:integrating conjugative element protein n=1 Tax=Allopusillimonas ginsengisoli TaxID=453575 RepID=UPI0039C0FECF
MKMPRLAACGLFLMIVTVPLSGPQAAEPLIVVEDGGGVSALPYYEALNLPLRGSGAPRSPIPIPQIPLSVDAEAQMLPVRSAKLTPGSVTRRVIEAPGLQPFFLIGDDEVSHAWLRRHGSSLRERNASGLVVNVETMQGLERLRSVGSGLQLWPVSADDLADRLGLRHYPALITATGIEQ